MKRFILAIALMLATPVFAQGFMLGYMMGSSSSSSSTPDKPKPAPGDSHLVAASSGDVLMCPTSISTNPGSCTFQPPCVKSVDTDRWGRYPCAYFPEKVAITPLDYAKKAGYSKVLQIGSMVTSPNDITYLVMRVEK